MRWLWAWAQSLWARMAAPISGGIDPIDVHPYDDVLRRLDVMDSRLVGIERRLGLPAGPGVPAIPPALRDLDCGHRSGSYATHPSGLTECLDCYQASYR